LALRRATAPDGSFAQSIAVHSSILFARSSRDERFASVITARETLLLAIDACSSLCVTFDAEKMEQRAAYRRRGMRFISYVSSEVPGHSSCAH
jgi:hypothetical protein